MKRKKNKPLGMLRHVEKIDKDPKNRISYSIRKEYKPSGSTKEQREEYYRKQSNE